MQWTTSGSWQFAIFTKVGTLLNLKKICKTKKYLKVSRKGKTINITVFLSFYLSIAKFEEEEKTLFLYLKKKNK